MILKEELILQIAKMNSKELLELIEQKKLEIFEYLEDHLISHNVVQVRRVFTLNRDGFYEIDIEFSTLLGLVEARIVFTESDSILKNILRIRDSELLENSYTAYLDLPRDLSQDRLIMMLYEYQTYRNAYTEAMHDKSRRYDYSKEQE